MTTALVFGRAQGVWDEIEAAMELGCYDHVLGVGSAGVDYAGEFDHWVSFHASLFPHWAQQRSVKQRPPVKHYWSSMHRSVVRRRSANDFPVTCIRCEGGSSGYIGAVVALERLAADRVVLAGIPMDPDRAQYDQCAPWKEALKHRDVWRLNVGRLHGKVRSWSGWTRQLLGGEPPTRAWLTEGS